MGMWSTAFSGNKTTFQQYANLNASERPYFIIPKETYKPFVSEVFNTINFNQVPRIVIAYPVLSLKPDAITTTTDSGNLNPDINQSLSNTMDVIASLTNITSIKNFTEFKDQPILFNLDTEFLKDNFEFKGIVTASINSAALDNYINNALFTRNIINNTNDSGNIALGNPSIYNNTLNSDESQNLEYSNIIRSPLFFLIPSFTSSSTYETLSATLKPDILVTDNNGVVIFSSDERIEVGSDYLSTENFALIKKEYNSTTAGYLKTVFQNLTNDKEQSYRGTLELINKQGNKIIVNIEPILFNGQHIFYLSTNTKFFLSETANNLISNQIVFTFLFVGCLLSMVFSFIAVVLSINRKLKHEVNNKTSQLLQNVRDLEFSNEKLIQSEDMVKEFVNTAAHELRTPTQAITGYSELDDELFDDIFKNKNITTDPALEIYIKRLYQHHENISRNATRLDNLVNNLLDVAKLDSSSRSKDGLATLYKEKVDLVKEINETVNLQLERKINDKNIKINLINNSLGEPCWVYVDKSRLNQILTNLIDNAIKFSKNDGSIDILVKENGMDLPEINSQPNFQTGNLSEAISKDLASRKEVYIGISDTGKGISSTIMPKLFGKFITDSDYGTGLGLYITKRLVEAHGGRIWAFNNNDGVGSTFIFSLPRFDDAKDKVHSP
ncbi:sensor histidine kinase [Candidatus Nitrosocosmicus arcticus]|uniref:histidine kinase n=1 Tax=Candidatus Nitrosocosmicus arcticus TaxID=2035267 RepID=A0A557SX41_9ARCH|nr:HAMP domain-containing sensor histidine kinase [Candidatus Nitrosocosmicus arcticus]TVP41176.1 putative Histidine kinase [Candidatus Nitrosocosmicus arcticus]